MPRRNTELVVFISCPGDLGELRAIAERAVQETSETLRVTHNILLSSLTWQKDLLPGVSTDGQMVINEQTAGVYDIYIGMMGARFGTPTPRSGSGTEEEFEIAIRRFLAEPASVRLLFYFQQFGIDPFSIDPEQLRKVKSFRTSLEAKGVLHHPLTDLDDVLASLKRHLLLLVQNEWLDQSQTWRTHGALIGTNHEKEIRFPLADLAQVSSLDGQVNDPDFDEPGLLDIYSFGVDAIQASSVSMAQIASETDKLGEQFNARTERFQQLQSNKTSDVNLIRSAIDGLASDINEYIEAMRGHLAAGKESLLRGADFMEAYYREAARAGGRPVESNEELSVAISLAEPALKKLRTIVGTAKQTVADIPPMTAKLRSARGALLNFYDHLMGELTVFIERFRLMRHRLDDLTSNDINSAAEGLSE